MPLVICPVEYNSGKRTTPLTGRGRCTLARGKTYEPLPVGRGADRRGARVVRARGRRAEHVLPLGRGGGGPPLRRPSGRHSDAVQLGGRRLDDGARRRRTLSARDRGRPVGVWPDVSAVVRRL